MLFLKMQTRWSTKDFKRCLTVATDGDEVICKGGDEIVQISKTADWNTNEEKQHQHFDYGLQYFKIKKV